MSSDSKRVDEPRREQAFTLLLICIGSALAFASLGMTRPLVVLLANNLGASSLWIGIIVASYAFIPFFLALHVGAATDQYGPRLLIIIGSLGFAAAMVIIAVFPVCREF